MTKLLYSSETIGCGATIKLDSQETCLVSVAQSGVLVRSCRGRFGRILLGFFGAVLYNETNVHKAATTAMALDSLYPEKRTPITFRNPVLGAFANAIWHCSTAAEVAVTLNEAIAKIEQAKNAEAIVNKALDAASSLGALMEQYPLAILDVKKLPLPKAEMKLALKIAWENAPNDYLRNAVEVGYIGLAHFQDGVGDKPIDGKLPDSFDRKKILEILDPWLPWLEKATAESAILLEELKEFKRQKNQR